MNLNEYFDCNKISGRYEQAVALETAVALESFCKQEPEFKQAVEQSGKTFQECLTKICKGIKGSISDIEVYRRAVKFYFSTAEVHFNMTIDLSGGNGYEAPPITVNENKPAPAEEKKPSEMTISLDDLLGDL